MFYLDNSEPLSKKKPPHKDPPSNLSLFDNKQCGSSFSKINAKSNLFIYYYIV